MNTIIKLENIKKIYKNGSIEVEALAGVDLEIKEGEFTSIMGSSGSGKSTMMNILGCLDRATEGTYLLDGIDVWNLKDKKLAAVRNKKIGFVFQSFNLLPKLSALANVEVPMVYAGAAAKVRHEKAMEALERVGLADRAKHRPNELSGGQRQRVAIARALVNEPAIILADEPTGNLDSKSSVEIMSIFQRLNTEGVTIVMVTHEEDISQHTKRRIVFKDGRTVKDEPVADVIWLGADECVSGVRELPDQNSEKHAGEAGEGA